MKGILVMVILITESWLEEALNKPSDIRPAVEQSQLAANNF